MSGLEKLYLKLSDFQKSLGSIFKVLLRSNFSTSNSLAVSESIIIMGNGPSLKNELSEHTTLLKNNTTLAVNFFANTQFYTTIQPNIYLINAPEFWMEEIEERFEKLRTVFFKNIIELTSWEMEFQIPASAFKSKYFNEQKRFFPQNISVVRFNPIPVEGLSTINHFFFSKNLGMPRPHNVIIPCMMNCINAGYKNIALIGVDHSWLPELSVNEDNVAMLHQKHFYDSNSSKDRPMKNLERKPRKLHEILEKFYFSFRGYFIVRNYAESRSANIYNCTKGSFIDAFDRKTIRTLFDEQLPKSSKTELD